MTTDTLNKALLAAQKAVGALVKNARNDFGGWDYVSAESVLIRSKDTLNEHGLFVRIGMENAHEVAGSPFLLTEYVLTHAESGESVVCSRDWPIDPSKGQNAVRAAAVTSTSGLAYFLRDLLVIPRGAKDDLNHASHDDRKDSGAPSPAALRTTCEDLVKRLPVERQDKATMWLNSLGTDADKLANAVEVFRSQVNA